jgi:hypothetical protein
MQARLRKNFISDNKAVVKKLNALLQRAETELLTNYFTDSTNLLTQIISYLDNLKLLTPQSSLQVIEKSRISLAAIILRITLNQGCTLKSPPKVFLLHEILQRPYKNNITYNTKLKSYLEKIMQNTFEPALLYTRPGFKSVKDSKIIIKPIQESNIAPLPACELTEPFDSIFYNLNRFLTKNFEFFVAVFDINSNNFQEWANKNKLIIEPYSNILKEILNEDLEANIIKIYNATQEVLKTGQMTPLTAACLMTTQRMERYLGFIDNSHKAPILQWQKDHAVIRQTKVTMLFEQINLHESFYATVFNADVSFMNWFEKYPSLDISCLEIIIEEFSKSASFLTQDFKTNSVTTLKETQSKFQKALAFSKTQNLIEPLINFFYQGKGEYKFFNENLLDSLLRFVFESKDLALAWQKTHKTTDMTKYTFTNLFFKNQTSANLEIELLPINTNKLAINIKK